MQLSIYAILLIIRKDADGDARCSQLVWREQTTNEYILCNRENTLLADKTSIFDGKVMINYRKRFMIQYFQYQLVTIFPRNLFIAPAFHLLNNV